MKKIFTLLTISLVLFSGCKPKVKQQQDSIYSRHLQRHVPLEIITTPMPDNKEEMNLLLFNSIGMLEGVRAKAIIDSLYRKKLIQPLVLVAFEGKIGDYGIEESETPGAKQYKKFNDFVINELYPFIKKKVVIRKFNSVAVCGFYSSALSSFETAYKNDEKIQSVGLFNPSFYEDSTTVAQISSMRQRPKLNVWMTYFDPGPLSIQLGDVLKSKKSITVSEHIKGSFADFLIWAFPK
jgi:enterochelin esterase-like enzyme